jgi:hypothetical protein
MNPNRLPSAEASIQPESIDSSATYPLEHEDRQELMSSVEPESQFMAYYVQLLVLRTYADTGLLAQEALTTLMNKDELDFIQSSEGLQQVVIWAYAFTSTFTYLDMAFQQRTTAGKLFSSSQWMKGIVAERTALESLGARL